MDLQLCWRTRRTLHDIIACLCLVASLEVAVFRALVFVTWHSGFPQHTMRTVTAAPLLRARERRIDSLMLPAVRQGVTRRAVTHASLPVRQQHAWTHALATILSVHCVQRYSADAPTPETGATRQLPRCAAPRRDALVATTAAGVDCRECKPPRPGARDNMADPDNQQRVAQPLRARPALLVVPAPSQAGTQPHTTLYDNTL